MDTVSPQPTEWSADQYAPDEQLPPRRRRRLLTGRSAVLGALVMCAIGFYAGVRLEKGQLAGSAAGASAGTAAGRAGATGPARSRLARLFAAPGRGAAAGGAGGVPGAGAGAGASFGTVASIKGSTIYVTGASGNTVKVRLSSATKVAKTEAVSRAAIHPGDTVVVRGVTGSGGTVSAASVTDSGSGGGGGGAGSAVSSLFSSGG